ncbi:ZMAT1 protein, partial [Thalassarche chlororhynchos]|nr:ZMAT1 protein [Thalassarche chlororhynchos]
DDVLDEATRKDLFTDTFCKVCRAVLQFESQRMAHYKGKKHAQKVRLYIQMHGEKDERQEHGKQKKTDCINFQMDGSGVLDKNKYCNLCNVVFTSPVVALSHYLGKIHAKKLKQLSGDQAHMPAQSMQPVSAEESLSSSNIKLKLNDPDKYCKLCCAPFNNPLVAQQHYVGKKHRRNEARKKILEELGDKAVSAESGTNVSLTYRFLFSAVGVGYYMCPVCNVTLTSIETCIFNDNPQGKDFLSNLCRETVLVNHMKKSKKTYDSFQDELTDYIKVQKARGLEPRRYLGKAEEEEFQDKNIEGGSDLGEVISSNFKCQQGQHSSLFSETQSPTNTGENRSPSWPSACEHALEKTPDCHYNMGYCKGEQEEQASEVVTIRDKSFSLSVAESEDCYKLMLAETSTSSYRKEQKFQIKHFEEEKYISEELKYEKEATKQKRKENTEGADFGKENQKQKRIKFDIDLVNEKRSRPYKDKRLKENLAEKESKKHKKDKKKPQADGKREEELLWDQSVL